MQKRLINATQVLNIFAEAGTNIHRSYLSKWTISDPQKWGAKRKPGLSTGWLYDRDQVVAMQKVFAEKLARKYNVRDSRVMIRLSIRTNQGVRGTFELFGDGAARLRRMLPEKSDPEYRDLDKREVALMEELKLSLERQIT